jgi:hypothetical protein
MARVHHEHTVSKNYTPLYLGEILTTRSFTATGEINKLALTDKDKTKWTKLVQSRDTDGLWKIGSKSNKRQT